MPKEAFRPMGVDLTGGMKPQEAKPTLRPGDQSNAAGASCGGGSSGSCGACGCGSCACGTGGGECGFKPEPRPKK